MTGFLVRSVNTNWAKHSILAVDAGVHLSSIIRVIEDGMPKAIRYNPMDPGSPTDKSKPPTFRNAPSSYFSPIAESRSTRSSSPAPQIDHTRPKVVLTTGPFKELILPYDTPKANASYLLHNLISTYLITHPHLDHISGFAINTAAFQHTSRPKKLAALPQVIDSIKTHIFNDVIWPNLSDEEGGVGFVSYQRLVEGGNLALGEGEGRGYIEVCEGLSVKCWSVSHGHCMRKHSHRPSTTQEVTFPHPSERRASRVSMPTSPDYRRNSFPHIDVGQFAQPSACVIDSCAFFIRDEATGKELLMFGDVEPDSISLYPRTIRVWQDAAPKIVAGLLSAIFIECSYDDSQPDEILFGHLAPRHLIAELCVLAEKVKAIRNPTTATSSPITERNPLDMESVRKRKRNGTIPTAEDEIPTPARRRGRTPSRPPSRRTRGTSISPTTNNLAEDRDGLAPYINLPPLPNNNPHLPTNNPPLPTIVTKMDVDTEEKPLKGLKVVVIHVKDTLKDGVPASEVILKQLLEQEEVVRLGCEILVAKSGEGMWI